MTNSYKADTTNNTINEYFDLHTTGVGYVNRIREVTPKQGDAFMACTIGALRGSKSAVEYSYFDCRVSGAEASKVIRRLDKACEENKLDVANMLLQALEMDISAIGGNKEDHRIATEMMEKAFERHGAL